MANVGRLRTMLATALAVAAPYAVSAVAPASASASASARPVSAYSEYVALGDSFAAGPLIAPQVQVDPCLRSARNYPHLLAEALQVTQFRDATCSGAKTAHVFGPQPAWLPWHDPAPAQLDAVTATTTLVTITIGANDAGLTSLAGDCKHLLAPPFGTSCKQLYTASGVDEGAHRVDAVAARLAGVLEAVHDKAPRARIYITSYTDYSPPGGCFPQQPIWPEDADYVQSLVNRLAAVTKSVAAQHRATFVDLIGPAAGHDGCQGEQAWATLFRTGATSGSVPLHPTELGEAAFAGLLAKQIARG